MRCKTCGSQVLGNAEFCPNCGVTIHHSAESEMPEQAVPAQEAAYRQPERRFVPPVQKAPERVQRPVRGRAGLRVMFSMTVMLLLLVSAFGTIFFNIVRLHYENTPETVYTGISYSMGYRYFIDNGMGGFFDDMDKLTAVSMIIVILMFIAVLFVGAMAAAKVIKRHFSEAAKYMGIGFMFPLFAYIISFIDAIYLRSTYLDDGFSKDKCHLCGAPLLMMILCSAEVFITFLAADSMDRKKSNPPVRMKAA
ncbi:MAG TPA: zinc ribbon domain-containing protein [Ruminococcus sp.]|nr:zinc ribbon domain-containing protein [Ruminococcus sp.]